MSSLNIFSDHSEYLNYNDPGFPLYIQKGELCQYENYTYLCHWHRDLEFIIILDGIMNFFINGKHLTLKTNEGIFINSRRLHYGYSKEKNNCTFICIRISPNLLGENTPSGKKFLESILGMDREDYLYLYEENGWRSNTMNAIKKLYEGYHKEPENPLLLTIHSMNLFLPISQNIQLTSKKNLVGSDWTLIWKMVEYIQQNYEQKITLDEIANSSSVSRSKCCKLFNKYLGQTPNKYLNNYRINKSCEMLKETQASIIEISLICGFQTPSYFTSTFQKLIGMNPKKYRKKYQKSNVGD